MTHVAWHPFPKERKKIKYGQHYFVTLESGNVIVIQTTKPEYGYYDEFGYFLGTIIAFAEIELPEPYVPTIKKKEPPPVVHIDYFGDHPDDIWGWKERLKEETK